MNPTPKPSAQPPEDDGVWQALEKATATTPGPSFVENTVKTARLIPQDPEPWWQRLLGSARAMRPTTLAGLTAATAALAIAVVSLSSKQDTHSAAAHGFDSEQALTIQEIAETEVLIAAAENPSEFSDQELVCLLGF